MPLHDYGCTLKAYRRDVIKGVRLYGEMHRFIPIYATWMGAKVCEMPVRHHARRAGQSKYGLERIFKVVLDLIVVKFLDRYFTKPIYVFGGFGILALVMSVVFVGLALYWKFAEGISMIRTPMPVLAGMTFLVGVISILMGLLAEILVRIYFETQQRPAYSVRSIINSAVRRLMCGIAGFVGRGDRDDLIAMTRALAHRGPDEDGFHVDEGLAVYLGHRRLTIRDAAGGVQPMWNEDKTVCVIFNGEIYNHVELRAELTRHGHVFRSDHSDTEVLVHGYEQWGAELAGRLNGMFAFAVFDARRRRLFLARDRFGEKPLYYYKADGLFAFASELSALPRHSQIPARPSLAAVRKFFAWGYIPAPMAYYEGTAKLPAGHVLEFDIAARTMRVDALLAFPHRARRGIRRRAAKRA